MTGEGEVEAALASGRRRTTSGRPLPLLASRLHITGGGARLPGGGGGGGGVGNRRGRGGGGGGGGEGRNKIIKNKDFNFFLLLRRKKMINMSALPRPHTFNMSAGISAGDLFVGSQEDLDRQVAARLQAEFDAEVHISIHKEAAGCICICICI